MTDGVVLGTTADGEEVALSYDQRRQNTYVIGVNGTGKTTILRQLAYDDMRQEPKHGLCVIDPHGDLIDDLIDLLPENRLDDVILFDPSKYEANPFALNLFGPVPPKDEIGRFASEIVSIFRKIFGSAWTPEIEGVVQSVTLTLLARSSDFKLNGKEWIAAMDEIPALLAMERIPDEDREKPPWKRRVETYRSQFYQELQEQDQIPIWEFWNYNFDTLTPRPRSELTLAVLNQVRRFLSNPTVRNIVAQTENRLDLSEIMKDGKILLVNLSKGKLGEANSAFLGSVIVAKIVVAVFARANETADDRRPFHLIVDEFQNFAISSFPSLLSEGRKYGVDLVVAHQYRDQLRDWVQGATTNAGNTICFRLGGDDAHEMAREFDATPPPGPWDMESLYQRFVPETKRMPHAQFAPPDGSNLYIQKPTWRYWNHENTNIRDGKTLEWYTERRGPTLYHRVHGRPRSYSDLYQEIGNELSHLPNYQAMIRLAGSELPTIERRITTLAWPTNAPTGKELRKNRSAAAKAVWKNTKPFTRTREAVESKFRERYQQMLNSIGMTWDPDEPLPKPQVLYEDDD